jgi:hypothetical protein
MLAQARQRAALVAPHQPGVADNVDSDDSRQFALLTGLGELRAVGALEMVEQGARNTASGALLAPWLP